MKGHSRVAGKTPMRWGTLTLKFAAFVIAILLVLSGQEQALATVAPPLAVFRALHDCPARSLERGWPHAADIRLWALGRTRLYIVRCESAGDDEYYAAVTQTGSVVRRQSFPTFEGGRMVADVVDREASRQKRLGQLRWDRRSQRLVGEISAGCAARTEYRYRWTGKDFVLNQQRSGRGCEGRTWHVDYQERRRPGSG